MLKGPMTTGEKWELGLIPLFIMITWLLVDLSGSVGVGTVILWLAALFLAQGLVRDLSLLATKSSGQPGRTQQPGRCLCVESAIGLGAIVIGASLTAAPIVGFGFDQLVMLSPLAWSNLILITMGLCFLMKDYILLGSPLRIRRDPDHSNILFGSRSDS